MGTLDDTITLGGQVFPIMGSAQGDAVSEFEAGIKVGKAKYDNREHAFFQVHDDFSGGVGHRHMDVREEQGNFWDAVIGYGADTRRPSHLTLPPLRTELLPDTDPSGALSIPATHRASLRGDDGAWLMGVANSIYRSENLSAWTLVRDSANAPSQCTAIIRTSAQPADAAPAAVYMACYTAARYDISEDGITWQNGAANKTFADMIWWDNKAVAINITSTGAYQIIFGVLASGAESWNIDDSSDGQPVVTINTHVTGRFPFILGIAEAPDRSKGQVIYFSDGLDIFWLDFYARRAHKVNIDIASTVVINGCIWEGNVVWTDGWEVWSYSPSSGTLREIGLPKRSGIPPSLGSSYLWALAPGGQFLYATLVGINDDEEAIATALCYNGVGWHVFGGRFIGVPGPLFIMSPTIPSFTNSRALVVPTNVDFPSTILTVYHFYIPNTGHTPLIGRDSFGQHARWITGWMDGGFNDIFGTLLRLNIDAFGLTTTEKVTVYFQLDNDETSNWIQMCDANGDAASFDSTNRVLYFNATNPGRGRKFRTVRFRYDMERDVAFQYANFVPANSERLSHADDADLELGDADATIAFMAKVDDLGVARVVTGKYITTGNQRSWVMQRTSGNRFSFFASSDGSAQVSASPAQTIAVDTWYFVVGRYNATTDLLTLSIDGQFSGDGFASTSHASGFFDGTAVFEIGARNTGGAEFWDGGISRVAIWSGRALSDAEVTELKALWDSGEFELTAALETDLLGYWHLNEYSNAAGAVTRSDHGPNVLDLTDNNTVTSDIDGDFTLSPEVNSFTWVYLKTPELRTQWTFTIDVNRMVEEAAGEEDSDYQVDAVDASVVLAWQKLKTLWINDHRLLRLVVPTVEPDGINVKISGMPVAFDDFRDAVDGRAQVSITVIEVVESIDEATGAEVTVPA